MDPGDRCLDTAQLLHKPLAVTVKMDGSCVTLTRAVCGARNGREANHPSFAPLKALHATFRDRIAPGVQLFGEWLYARHSIAYAGPLALPAYFQLFAVYDQDDQLFLAQDDVRATAADLGLAVVPTVAHVCYDAEWQLVQGLTEIADRVLAAGHEGVVVKSVYPYPYSQFDRNTAKFVRPHHVQTDEHWRQQKIVKNELSGKDPSSVSGSRTSP